MRVNARLDEESQRQIDYLTETTGMAVSHVLRESVGLYYRQVRAQRSGIKHLSALIGKGQSGRSDIASAVKLHLGEALAERYRESQTRAHRPEAAAASKPASRPTKARRPSGT